MTLYLSLYLCIFCSSFFQRCFFFLIICSGKKNNLVCCKTNTTISVEMIAPDLSFGGVPFLPSSVLECRAKLGEGGSGKVVFLFLFSSVFSLCNLSSLFLFRFFRRLFHQKLQWYRLSLLLKSLKSLINPKNLLNASTRFYIRTFPLLHFPHFSSTFPSGLNHEPTPPPQHPPTLRNCPLPRTSHRHRTSRRR